MLKNGEVCVAEQDEIQACSQAGTTAQAVSAGSAVADLGARWGDRLPDGEPLQVDLPPPVTLALMKRLRKIVELGRPMMLQTIGRDDFDLLVLGFIQHAWSTSEFCPLPVVVPTRLGMAELHAARQRRIASLQPHNTLADRLARHLRSKGNLTWLNCEFVNPVRGGLRSWTIVRPDVYTCLPNNRAESVAPAAYEVKVSRSDYLADIAQESKRGAYADLAEAVYYCCPEGLISAQELPEGFGLIVERAQNVFVVQKRARRRKGFVMDVSTALTLMVKRRECDLDEEQG